MIKIKLYILSVLLLLVSCTGNKVIDEQITRADSLMEANSDSALVALGMLDSLRENNPKMSKAQQMRFELIYAKGMNKGFVDFTTDSVMKQVVAYYDKHGSANERMLAYYLLGFAPNQMKILMGMSSSNISNIRKRLSKKLFDREMTTSKFDDEIRKIRVKG